MIRVSIATSSSSWYYPHAERLAVALDSRGCRSRLVTDHQRIETGQDIVFYLSYFRIVPQEFLKRSRHNIVIHESDLPKGRGWAPLLWQVIEGANEIPAVAFEAIEEMDAGPIYARTTITLDGTELHDELRLKQAQATRDLVFECVEKYQREQLTPLPQSGQPTYYHKRTPQDSRVDPDQTLRSQFDLLRTVNNREFPAYFDLRGHRYILRIEKDTGEEA